jgi:hypothetical protein
MLEYFGGAERTHVMFFTATVFLFTLAFSLQLILMALMAKIACQLSHQCCQATPSSTGIY